MSYNQTKIDIVEFFETQLRLTEATIKVIYDNLGEEVQTDSEYIRFSVNPLASSQIEAGASANFRFEGILFIQILTKTNQGEGRINSLVDTCTDIFRRKVTEGIRFRGETTRNINTNANKWYQKNISVPFERDNIYTI